MDVVINMKSGKVIELDVHNADMKAISLELNKVKFIRFGILIINTSEIETIQEKS